eukprot:774001-Prymnesium_polylepis.1
MPASAIAEKTDSFGTAPYRELVPRNVYRTPGRNIRFLPLSRETLKSSIRSQLVVWKARYQQRELRQGRSMDSG